MQILLRPYPNEEKLIFLAPTEGFLVHIKIALFAGIILSLPVIFYQLWRFVAPGLYTKEKKFNAMITEMPELIAKALFYYLVVGGW